MFPSDQRNVTVRHIVVVYGNRDDRNLRGGFEFGYSNDVSIQFREFSQAGIKTCFSQTCFEVDPL